MRASSIKSDSFANKKILITGGAGFIGSNLAIRLVNEGAKVTIIDSMIPEYGGNPFNLEPVVERLVLNVSDVRDRFSLRQLVAGQDILFNLAGQSSHLDSMIDPFTDHDINCRSQLAILEVCRAVNPDIKLIYASTRQLYGRPAYLPVDEDHPVRPVDINGIHKLAGESYHILYHQVYGIRTCALRLTNTIGPRMRIKDARQTFVGSWIRALLEQKPITVWGGQQLRDFNDVDDVVDAFLLCADSELADGKIFNLGAPPISLHALAKLMVAIHRGGSYCMTEFPEDRLKIDIGDYYGSYSLIHDTLGWTPRTTLECTLERCLHYFRAHGSHYV